MNLYFLILTSVLSASLAFGCGAAPATQPARSLDGPTPTPTLLEERAAGSEPVAEPPGELPPRVTKQIRVKRFDVTEGSIERISAGTEIVSEEGIEIAGTIRVDDSVDGDFVLTAKTGDIVISGSIIVDSANAASRLDGIRFVSSEPFDALPLSKWLNQNRATPRPGVSYVVNPQQGDIVIARLTRFEAGDGQSALDERIASWIGDDFYEGTNGAPGGDIVLRAPNGVIRLPTDRKGGDPAIFDLGNGGDGANVLVDSQISTADDAQLLVGAGNGGRSGRLMFSASVEGVPSGSELFDNNMRLIVGGIGGKGGYAVWITGKTSVARLNEEGGVVEWSAGAHQMDPLSAVEMHGGHGGDGARVGGNGGVGGYLGANVNVGQNIATVEVSGGQGGDVFESPVPVVAARGGDGGGFYAHGNGGWNGGKDKDGSVFRDGATGGSVTAWGNRGGHIMGDSDQFPAGAGGNGGGSGDAIIWDYVSLAHGGQGMNGCDDGGSGGFGGNTGYTRISGGDGGRGPLDGNSGEQGGDGGDVKVFFNDPGGGGNGNPPGAGGENSPVEVKGGIGGAGATSGKDGAWVEWTPGEGLEPFEPGKLGELCEGGIAAPPPDAHPFDFSCRAVVGYITIQSPLPRSTDALSICRWQLYDLDSQVTPSTGPGIQFRAPFYILRRNEDRLKEYQAYMQEHPEITPGE